VQEANVKMQETIAWVVLYLDIIQSSIFFGGSLIIINGLLLDASPKISLEFGISFRNSRFRKCFLFEL